MALPSVKVRDDVNIPDEVYKEIDPQTGDLILHNFTEYITGLDGLLETNLNMCQSKSPPEIRTRDLSTMQEDWYRTFRTLTVFLWITLNSFLVLVVTNIPKVSTFRPTADGGEGLLYVGSVLWAYAGVAGFQYLCTIVYSLRKLWSWLTSGVGRSKVGPGDKEKQDV